MKKALALISPVPVIYYAHPMGFYHTTVETETLELIKKSFPEYYILNPGEDRYQGYDMSFYENLVKTCQLVVCQIYDQKTMGAGVYKEILSAQRENIPVKIIRDGKIIDLENLEDYEVLSGIETAKLNREIKKELLRSKKIK